MAEYRFHTPEPVDLEVKVPVGDIDVETVDGEESLVVVEGGERLVERTQVELQGRKLVVETRGKGGLGFSISIGDFGFGNGRLNVRVQVPHGSGATLQTAAADMKLRGRVATLSTKSASGDLTAHAEIDGDATLKTVSGDVFLDSVGGDLRLQSVSGDVEAGAIGGSVEVKTVSGDVRVRSVRQGQFTAQSVSGDIEVGVAPGTTLDVDAGSVSGDLGSEVPLGSDPGSVVGEGPTLVVRGKTVSGDFRVTRAR
jgi:DUF4097 and DUF4098 domain-containing protein YvlB